MMWFIIFYLLGSVIAILMAASQIGKIHNPKETENPGCAIVYLAALLGSWITVSYLSISINEDDKNSQGKNV